MGPRRLSPWIVVVAIALVVGLGGWVVARNPAELGAVARRVVGLVRAPAVPAGFASGNGRIEATEYDIATKRAGRIGAVAVREGDAVQPGQILARMDIQDLAADLRQAEAQTVQAREDRRRALAAITQREADVQSAVAAIAQRQSDRRRADAAIAQRRSALVKAQATVVQRESQLALAGKELYRSQELFDRGLVARQKFDEDLSRVETAEAALAEERAGRQVAEGAVIEAEAQRQMAEAALVQQEAQRRAAEAALQAARVDVDYREAAISAAAAHVERIQTDIADSTLISPIRGRVLYRVAEPGEVLAAGGKVVTVLELDDVHMTIFLPAEDAGRTLIGAEGRIVLDAFPELVIPAAVSFVAPRAQFTPKEVETRTEREKLMFRVKVRIDSVRLARDVDTVKTGLPGMAGLRGIAYVRLDGRVDWPEHLRATLPR